MRINDFMRKIIIIVFLVFGAGILALSVGLYAANGAQSRELLAESIESHLLTIVSTAGKTKLSSGKSIGDAMGDYPTFDSFFEHYSGETDDYYDGEGNFIGADDFSVEYKSVLADLRELRDMANVDYLYTVVKLPDGLYRLVLDTDEEDEEPFKEYEGVADIEVFISAFAGTASAGVMNVKDEWGTFNTGAAPLYDSSGAFAGIICADIEDHLYQSEIARFTAGIITLSLVLTAVLVLFGGALVYLLKHIKRIQDNLNRMAHHDRLTGLPNRRYLLEQLGEMTTKKKNEPFALLFIDLDNFKKVNDSAGHDAGDELLRHIAAYLQQAHTNSNVFRMSAGAVNVTARVGGDEFIMIAPGIKTEKEGAAFAQEILDGFRLERIDKYIEKYGVGLSIGVALYPEHIGNFHALINYADAAMYHAKKSGKNCYSVYTDEMSQKTE